MPPPRKLILAAIIASVVAIGAYAASKAPGASAIAEWLEFLDEPETWLVADYGFFGDGGKKPAIANIDTRDRALRVLEFLDRRLPDSRSTPLPADLAEALEQIRSVAPDLAERPEFHRLEMLAPLRQ